MPKFYVSSGNFHLIVEADDARAAAIWAVHRCLSPLVPHVSEQDELTDDVQRDAGWSYQAPVSHWQLGEMICVSEQGFGGVDTEELRTLSIVAEWTRLLAALEQLQEQLI
jgi:hypothetical protein